MAVKQVIIWRNDLNCRVGKKMSQAGHAVLADFDKMIRDHVDADGNVSFQMTPAQFEWYLNDYRKIVLKVNSEADLLLLHLRAQELELPVEIIIDSGLTEWDEPTRTCLVIGPEEDSKIDELTGESGPLGRLKLM